MAKVTVVIEGRVTNISTITETTRFYFARTPLLMSAAKSQKIHIRTMHPRGSMQATIILANMGLVAMLLSRRKQSTDNSMFEACEMKAISFKNALRLSVQPRSYD